MMRIANLESFLATLNILSLLFHTLLELVDDKYNLLPSHSPIRKTFFNDLRALTRYLFFDITILDQTREQFPNKPRLLPR